MMPAGIISSILKQEYIKGNKKKKGLKKEKETSSMVFDKKAGLGEHTRLKVDGGDLAVQE